MLKMVHTKLAQSHKNIGQSVAPSFLLDPLRLDILNINWVHIFCATITFLNVRTRIKLYLFIFHKHIKR